MNKKSITFNFSILADIFPFGGGEEHRSGASVLRKNDRTVRLGGTRNAIRECVAELAHRDDVFGRLEIEHGFFSFDLCA